MDLRDLRPSTHAALTAVVSRYRTRGAVARGRQGAGPVRGRDRDAVRPGLGLVERRRRRASMSRSWASIRAIRGCALTLELARQLIGTPRHLSQHPGGFVLTRDRLDDLVPIEPAAMVDRRVIEWEKDDIEELKIMKVDVLGLGMLGCMRRAFDLLDRAQGQLTLGVGTSCRRTIPAVYAMIQQGRHDRRLPDREPRADVDAAAAEAARISTTSSSRSRSSGPGRSRATWSIPICGGARARRSPNIPSPSCARCWRRRWACRSSRSRR